MKKNGNQLGVDKKLLTKEQLKEELDLPSVRTVDSLRRRRKIPVCKMGYRTLRYDLTKVQAALEKLTVREADG